MAVPLLAGAMPLSAAMATLGIVGIACALLPTLLLPETAGRTLLSLDDFADTPETGDAAAAEPKLAQ